MSEDEKIEVEVTIGPATVRVRAPPERLEEAVRQVVSALKAALPQLASAEAGEGAGKMAGGERRRKPQPTCSSLLRQLVEEGWFDKPRSLSEAVQELARRGYTYDSTAVSHSLLDLVRERVLVREGSPRRYVYYRPAAERAEREEAV